MKWKAQTTFQIHGLNQEKTLNELAKIVTLEKVCRESKTDTIFECPYLKHKKVEKLLKSKGFQIVSMRHEGILWKLQKIATSYGLVLGVAVFFILQLVASQFVVQYEITGVDKQSQVEITSFVKKNFPNKKSAIDTKQIEISLMENFDSISFASCMIKGQTLLVNIKEKLLPNEIYGQFKPIVARSDAKISQINLVSGTLTVKVGDFVRMGDVLVEPFVVDSSGSIKKVEAKAEIMGEVYNLGESQHFSSRVEVSRTGKTIVQNSVLLFGLEIYTFKEENNFKLFETESEDINLIKNLPLPFKLKKTTFFELQEKTIESNFEDVKDEFIEKARQKALQNVENCDKIIEEFYTLRHQSNATFVDYCIVTKEPIGVFEGV